MFDSTVLWGLWPQKPLTTNSFGLTFTRNVSREETFPPDVSSYESDPSSLNHPPRPGSSSLLAPVSVKAALSYPIQLLPAARRIFVVHTRDWGLSSSVNADHPYDPNSTSWPHTSAPTEPQASSFSCCSLRVGQALSRPARLMNSSLPSGLIQVLLSPGKHPAAQRPRSSDSLQTQRVAPSTVSERGVGGGVWILSFKNIQGGTSLRIQWIRIRLPMQRTQIRSLVWEDFTCCGATKPVHSNEDPAQPEKEKQNKNFWFQSTPTRPTQLANTPPATSWPEEGCQGAYRVAPITLRAVSFLFFFLQPMM